ncbi:DNA-binding transcriptional regulator Fis [Buchnera aphidicola (Hormaphis cornu)]|nr:DNA-binding transcriptional regulator Fis [Buchnera aphidicola (Hormaphis cornu)]
MLNKYSGSKDLIVSFVNAQEKVVKKPLSDSVKQAIKYYLLHSKGRNIVNIYKLVLFEIEKPLLDIIMQYTRGNQTQAALMLGINRATLRKKLKKYSLG